MIAATTKAIFGVRGYALAGLLCAALMAAVLVERHWYGTSQYKAGADARQVEIEQRQAAIERAWQEEIDRADAKYRGAVMAREVVEKTVATQRGRIGWLLRQLAQRHAEVAAASSGHDAAGPDWVGIIGSCVGRYEELGKDAAGWADQVNALRGYIRAVR